MGHGTHGVRCKAEQACGEDLLVEKNGHQSGDEPAKILMVLYPTCQQRVVGLVLDPGIELSNGRARDERASSAWPGMSGQEHGPG